MPTQIIAPQAGQVVLHEYEAKQPENGQITVKSLYTAISPGTELAWIYNDPNTSGQYPMYPGYSGCGEVVAVADDVTDIRIGDKVAAPLQHAAVQSIAATGAVVVPDDTNLRDLSPFRLATIAQFGARRPKIDISETVIVFGLGPIGFLAAQWARIAGAQHVIAVDLMEERRELAHRAGFEAVSPEELKGVEAPVVIEATGVPHVLPLALEHCQINARIVLLGSTRGNVENFDVYTLIHKKGVDLIGAHAWMRPNPEKEVPEDDRTSVSYYLQGRLHLGPLISSVHKPKDCAQVYAHIRNNPSDGMVPVFDWTED